jgi:hypothetical protein
MIAADTARCQRPWHPSTNKQEMKARGPHLTRLNAVHLLEQATTPPAPAPPHR